MRRAWLAGWILLLAPLACHAVEIYTDIPADIHPDERYVFYSHGLIVEGDDEKPVSPKYGRYDFPAIKQALFDKGGFNLIAYHRPRDADIAVHATMLESWVRKLVEAGVPPSHITLIGFSRGGQITALASSGLRDLGINTAILAMCSKGEVVDFPSLVLGGRLLTIYETTDEMGSCEKLGQRGKLASFEEVSITTGRRHGAFFQPLPQWVNPLKDWIARSESPSAEVVSVENAWFKPILEESHDPTCDEIHRDILSEFGTSLSEEVVQDGLNISPFARLQPVEISEEETSASGEFVVKTREQALYLQWQNLGGCGGACETTALQVSDSTFSDAHPVVSTSAARAWGLFSNAAGDYFAAANVITYSGAAQNVVEVYKLVHPKKWQRTCAIRLTPTDSEIRSASNVAAARQSVVALESEVRQIMGQEGSCGSMRTRSRWQSDVTTYAAQALYRPWAMSEETRDSYGVYSEDLRNLETWALGGLAERESFSRYRAQFESTAAALTDFYVSQFRVPRPRARQIANNALVTVASAGIRFYEYQPFTVPGEKELRRNLLEHRPLAEIQGISIAAHAIEAASEESVLNVAVSYPEALRYLLERKFNANKANAFGKTPLMYAVQHNQLESVELLLAQGADPNAATVRPLDTCTYTLETSGMTPLHYAARYASSSIIRALLARDAFTFQRAEGTNHGTPLDWLRRYTESGASERNAAIPPEEVKAVAALLAMPSEKELAQKARHLMNEGRRAYAAKSFEAAYRNLRAAATLMPDDSAVRNDFALAALRNERFGESAAESFKSTTSPAASVRAAAYFNLGLACEAFGQRYLEYDGRYFCETSPIVPFLTSWQIEPSKARVQKLEALFHSRQLQPCVIGESSATPRTFHFVMDPDRRERGVRTRIYVLHPASVHIDPADFSWIADTPLAKTPLLKGELAVSARHELDKNVITVLDSSRYVRPPVRISGETCTGAE